MNRYPWSRLAPFFIAGDLLARAAEVGCRRAKAKLRGTRRSYLGRRPGADTPMWNLLATEVRRATSAPGAKARLARYLGLPRQRITDFLTSKQRLPDAEVALRLVHWVALLQRGRDQAS